jgi:hypothetical protein
LPQRACMIAFQAAWVSDHGGEGGGRWEGELTKARVRGEGRAGAGVAARVKAMAAVATPAGVMVARGQRGAGGRREAARAVADARLLLQGRSVLSGDQYDFT